MNPFWTLVRNDLKSLFGWKKSTWVLLIVLLGVITLFYKRMDLMPYELYIGLAMLFYFLPFGLAYHCVKREWKNGTASWWSTLPYSKEQLLGAKIVAIIVRVLQVYFLATLSSIVIGFIGIGYLGRDPLAMLHDSSKFLGDAYWALSSGPVSLLLGVIAALISESNVKKYSYLFFAGLTTLFMIYTSMLSQFVTLLASAIPQLGSGIHLTIVHWGGSILIGWLVTYLLYRYAVYLSERKIEA